jgi:uncharacterized protein
LTNLLQYRTALKQEKVDTCDFDSDSNTDFGLAFVLLRPDDFPGGRAQWMMDLTGMQKGRSHIFIQKTQLEVSPEQAWSMLRSAHMQAHLAPPWQRLDVHRVDRSFEVGSCFEFRVRGGLLAGEWKATVTQLRKGFLIGVDVLAPSRKVWSLWIKLLPGSTAHECVLEERLEYALGGLFAPSRKRLEAALHRVFYNRHRMLKADLKCLGSPFHVSKQKVLIAGGTGLIGRQVASLLRTRGHEVSILSTREDGACIRWDPEKGMVDAQALEGLDAVINLAGHNIACRWTKLNRRRILESRVKSTHLLVKTLLRLDRPPRQFLQASATGFYGYHGATGVDETTPMGAGFLAGVCAQWEAETEPLEDGGIGVKTLRFGVVLSPRDGALAKMLPAFRLGLGGPLGSGRQPFPWISIEDLARAVVFLMERPDLAGTYNLCAPNPPTQAGFARELGKVLHRPAITPAPALVLKLLFGKMAVEALLGEWVRSHRPCWHKGSSFSRIC